MLHRIAHILCAVLFTVLFACGGGSSSSSPSAPTPQYPNMKGDWSGTATVGTTANGVSATNVCDVTFSITNQSGGSFSGIFRNSGGTTVACIWAGTLSGTVSTSGALSVSMLPAGGAPTGCTLVAENPLAGIVSGSSLSLDSLQRFNCTWAPVAESSVAYRLTNAARPRVVLG